MPAYAGDWNMSVLLIDGGRKLEGSVRVHGAKNSVLPILAATILNSGINIIENCPRLKDVESSVDILRHLGCSVERDGDTLIVDSSGMCRAYIPHNLMREMRSSVIFLGAIIARTGEAAMSHPGGCELGPRPIDLHIDAFKKLGVCVNMEEGGNIVCKAGRMVGREISLSIPSVGATENIMLLACACKGTTTISNAAREPEIEDLQNYLSELGVRVSGAGSSTVTIEGCAVFNDARHRVIGDRIVAATYLSAAAIVGGNIKVTDVDPNHLTKVLSILAEYGCDVETTKNSISLGRQSDLVAAKPIRTMPYPGFPTDAQAPIMAVATRAGGTTVFVENIFEVRYRHVSELVRMGADIRTEGRVAIVSGVPALYGASVRSTDLRGGASLIVAALGAIGSSEISGLEHVDRGYECIEDALGSLGASIKRVNNS